MEYLDAVGLIQPYVLTATLRLFQCLDCVAGRTSLAELALTVREGNDGLHEELLSLVSCRSLDDNRLLNFDMKLDRALCRPSIGQAVVLL